MRKLTLVFLLFFSNLIFCQVQDSDKKYFKFEYDTIVKKTFVLDFEKLFDKNQTKELNDIIDDFEKKTSIEIAIISFEEKYKNEEDFHKNTLFVANWIGIGKKDLDNGILIGISTKSRKIRIENGNGIERILTDAETKSIIEDTFIPNFKKGNYYIGTLEGLKKIIEALEKKLNDKD